MNTAYRVWDGEKMHYWDDDELSLIISGGEWGCIAISLELFIPSVLHLVLKKIRLSCGNRVKG